MALKNIKIEKIQVKPRSVTVNFTHEQKKVPISGSWKIPAQPSKEFSQKLQKLVPFAMKTSALGYFEHALEQDALSKHIGTADLHEVKKIMLNYVNKSLSISSITFKRDEDGICGIIFTGSHVNQHGDASETKSPIVNLRENVFGYEKKLLTFCEQLQEEVIEFVNGNYTELPIEDHEEETEEEVVEEQAGEEDDELSLDTAPAKKLRVA